MALDIGKVAAAAAEAYLRENERRSPNGKVEKHSRLGGAGAVALGVGLAVAARVVYSRAKRFDLATAAGKVEDKLGG